MGSMKDILNLPCLTYSESTHAAVYHEDTGTWIPERTLQGKSKAYRSLAGSTLKQLPKTTLLLCDPMMAAWSFEKKLYFIECMKFLRTLGYQIYVYDKTGSFVREDDDITLRNTFPSYLRMTQDEMIENNYTLKNIPRSQIAFIDTQAVNEILATVLGKNNQINKAAFDMAELKMLTSLGYPEKLIATYLAKSYSAYANIEKKMILRSFITTSETHYISIKAPLSERNSEIPPQINIDIDLDPLSIEDEKNLMLIADEFKIKPYLLQSLHIKFTDFNTIEDDIQFDFSRFASCRSLRFTQCKGIEKILPNLKSFFPALEVLILDEINDLRPETINNILKQSTHLNELRVINFDSNGMTDFINDNTIWPDTLEVLEFAEITVNEIALKEICTLSKQRKIKSMDLHIMVHDGDNHERKVNCIWKDGVLQTNDLSFFGEAISLDLTPQEPNVKDIKLLENILRESRTLKTLVLNREAFDLLESIKNYTLEYLETLEVSIGYWKRKLQALGKILTKTQQLKNLSITTIKIIPLEKNQLGSLASLTSLTVWFHQGSFEFIYQALENAKKLTHLSVQIRNNNEEGEPSHYSTHLKNYSLKSMEVILEYKPCQEKIKNLTKLFNAAVNLEKLTIDTAKGGDIWVDLNESTFANLRILTLKGSLEEILKFFLTSARTPLLTELNCEFNSRNVLRLQHYLHMPIHENLERISFTGKNYEKGLVGEGFIVALTQHAPKLKYLQLNVEAARYRINEENVNLDKISLNSLEVLDISDSNFFNAEELYALLKKTPNLRELRINNRHDLSNMELPPGLNKIELILAENVYFEPRIKAAISDKIQSAYFVSLLDKPKLLTEHHHPSSVEQTVKPENENHDSSIRYRDEDEDEMKLIIDNHTETQNRSTLDTTYLFMNKLGEALHPKNYRLDIFDNLQFNTASVKRGESAFQWSNAEALYYLIDCQGTTLSQEMLNQSFSDLRDNPESLYYHARMKRRLTTSWQALPSISSQERLLHFSILELSPDQYEIKYSIKDNMHYIRLREGIPKELSFEYILDVPKIKPKLSNPDIQQLVNDYRKSLQDLPMDYQNGDGKYWIDALIKYKAGVCRHKATAFFVQMHSQRINARIISNDCHAFVEVKESPTSAWVTCDLGGAPSNFNINEGEFSQENTPKSPIPLNPVFIEEKSLDTRSPLQFTFDLFRDYPGKNILINFHDDQSLNEFEKYARELALREKRDLFYIDGPEDIQCHLQKMTRDASNKITLVQKQEGGSLFDFLKVHHDPSPILLINWNRFTQEEIIRFNSLMDKHRKADGIDIPADMTLIGLYNPDRQNAYKGEDFKSRFDNVLNPTFSKEMIQDARTKPITHSSDENSLHVYLHHSENWQSLLLGTYQVIEGEWYFKEGRLFEALREGKNVVIHDAPWEDRDFENFIDKMRIEKTISLAGKDYAIPDEFSITQGDPYPLRINAQSCLQIQLLEENKNLRQDIQILNPYTFQHFFQRPTMLNNKLSTDEGCLLKAESGSILKVYLTHSLTPGQWGQLIEKANEKNPPVTLQIMAHPNITLPSDLKECLTTELTYVYSSVFSSVNMIQSLPEPSHNALVIDCSDIELGDLFGRILTNNPGLLETELQNDKKIILTGAFSDEFEQAFLHWLTRHTLKPAQLILVSQKPIPALMPLVEYHPEKIDQSQTIIPYHENENLSEDFIQGRIQLLDHALQACPIVLIEGETGVGKSTFMHDVYAKLPHVKISTGLDSIDEWLKPSESNQTKILFIDEANISEDVKHEWTEFAGILNNQPPKIVIKGVVHQLSPHHKVVFAGNPNTYGGERESPKLFEDYPIARVTFNNIPHEYIIESILKPRLQHLPDWKLISQIFMSVYNESIMTVRDLEHMAHLYLVYQKPDSNPEILAKHCADLILNRSSHELNFPCKNPMKNHVITDSRRPLESRLNEFLSIRELKIQRQIKGGLGGIIIEGDPGTGKSEHVIAQLLANNLAGSFYHIPISMAFTEKKELLIKAFNEGAIVIIDEINSSPAMEKFFNDALSGKLEGVESPRPGFLLIGTQNPVSMGARRQLSEAMQRRLMHFSVDHFPHDEMVEVLEKGHHIPKALAEEIVKDLEVINQHRSHPLSMRSLIKNHKQAIVHIRNTLLQRLEYMDIPQTNALTNALVRILNSSSASSSSASERPLFHHFNRPETPSQTTQSTPPKPF